MSRIFWSTPVVILLVAAFFLPVSAASLWQTSQETNPPAGVPLPPETVQVIDDFESGNRGWEAFYDAPTGSSISCVLEDNAGENGSRALRIEFSLPAGGWANCSLLFDEPQDWSAAEWLAYDLHAEAGLVFNEILYGGAPDRPEMYTHQTEIFTQYEGFIGYFTFWKDFLRVEWEDNPGAPFQTPGRVLGVGFGFDAPSDSPSSGVLWIDNLRTGKSPSYDKPSGDAPDKRLPCPGSALAPLTLAGMAWSARRMARRK